MRRALAGLTLLLALLVAAPAALAVQPDEVLADPALEARARELSTRLRCMVCQNQSIDDSDADLARDLRLLVRRRLEAGDSDAQVIDYLVGRYGEFVLLQPAFSARNLLLWAMPVLVLGLGGLGAFAYMRRRGEPAPATLTDEERKRLDKLLGK